MSRRRRTEALRRASATKPGRKRWDQMEAEMAADLLRVETFERNAEVCRWEAQIAGSQKHKNILLEIAKEWDAMAAATRGGSPLGVVSPSHAT